MSVPTVERQVFGMNLVVLTAIIGGAIGAAWWMSAAYARLEAMESHLSRIESTIADYVVLRNRIDRLEDFRADVESELRRRP